MYLDYFGFERNPFPTTPQLDFFFQGGKRQDAIDAIDYALKENFGVIKVMGMEGVGKTMICRQSLRSFRDDYDVLLVSDPSLEQHESILTTVANELNPEWDLSIPKNKLFQLIMHTLVEHKKHNKPSVLFIEEAQKLTPLQLEELRYLTNLETSQEKLLQIVLFAQPSLEGVLIQTDLQLVSSRFTNSIYVEPLSYRDFKAYVAHRFEVAGNTQKSLLFSDFQLWVIYQLSNHSLRFANQLLEKTLYACFIRNAKKPSFFDLASANKACQNFGALIKYTRGQLLNYFSIGVLVGWLGFLASEPLRSHFHYESVAASESTDQLNNPTKYHYEIVDNKQLKASDHGRH